MKLPGIIGRRRGDEFQELRYHLHGTSKRAARFCSKFGAKNWGRIVGLFHDMGKCSLEFQNKITHELSIMVDHSTCGAQYLFNRVRGKTGKILAFITCGHHGGMPNALATGDNNRTPLHERLNKEIPAIPDECKREFKKIRLGNLRLPKDPFSIFMFIKMVYSTLVDADRLDSESYGSPEKSILRDSHDTLPILYRRIRAKLKELSSKSSPTEIDKIRTDIQKRGLRVARAWWDPRTWFRGFFTLTVPTGGGKTIASMAFALKHAVTHGFDRVIYVIPYSSIIEQNAQVFRDILGERNVLEHHCNFDKTRISENEREPHYLSTENWDAPVVVTTNVQFFESLYSSKASRSRRLHNTVNSVVVLDEVHLLPERLLKPCVKCLKELVTEYRCSIVLCTATQPGFKKTNGLVWGIEKAREIVKNPHHIYKKMERVKIEHKPNVNTDRKMAQGVKAYPQILTVVNTRKHAQLLYNDIRSEGHAYHLSTLMCAKHRRQVISNVKQVLGQGLPCRVVSTSLVECGVDFSFPIVVRDKSGIANIIQAGGRCNREGEIDIGRLIITNVRPLGPLSNDDFCRVAESITNQYLAQGKNLLDCDISESAFVDLYKRLEERLDKPRGGKPILKIIQDSGMEIPFEAIGDHYNGESLEIPFESIGGIFKMIETDAVSIIIPYDHRADELIDQLWDNPDDFRITRALQQYTVQVYSNWLYNIPVGKGRAIDTTIEPYRILRDMTYYSSETGLQVFTPEEIEKYRR